MPFIIFILTVAIGAVLLAGGAIIVSINIQDIAAHGANFWNVFWILLVGVLLFGGSSKAASS